MIILLPKNLGEKGLGRAVRAHFHEACVKRQLGVSGHSGRLL